MSGLPPLAQMQRPGAAHPQAAALLAAQQRQQHLAGGRGGGRGGGGAAAAGGGRGGGVAMAAAAAAIQAADTARRLAKKRKAADKPAVDKPLALIPESPLFNALMLQEQHVEELVKRRRLEIQAAANPYECAVPKRLRVYIYNTHAHQPAAGAAAVAGGGGSVDRQQEPPQWTLSIWGRLIDPEPPAAAPAAAAAAAVAPAAAAAPEAAAPAAAASAAAGGGGDGAADAAGSSSAAPAPAAPLDASTLPPQPTQVQLQQAAAHKYPFTGFFNSIRIQLDPQQYPGAQGELTWDRAAHRGPHRDRIEVKRIGSQPVSVTVTFEQRFSPPAYRVDPRLAEVLGMAFGHQTAVLTRLYHYILKACPVQPDLAVLQLDDRLEAILGAKQLPSASLPQALGKLLQPLQPVEVEHTIETSGPSPGAITCVDLDVLMPLKLQDRVAPAIDAIVDNKQIEVLDGKLRAALAKVFEGRRRRMMYLGFSHNPVGYLNTLIAGQAREMRTARGQMPPTVLERRTETFKEKWVEEAAARYLGRRNKQDALFPALNAS